MMLRNQKTSQSILSKLLFYSIGVQFSFSYLYGGEILDGTVLPLHEVTVSSPVQKVITKIHIEEGDLVKKGDLLCELMANVEKLEKDQTKKAMEMKAFENKASANLFKENLISEDEAMEQRIELELSELRYKIATEDYNINLIRSPLDGIILSKFKDSGESVLESEDIFVVINIDKVIVELFVPSEYIFKLKKGQKLNVRFPLIEKKSFKGVIHFVAPSIDRASGLLPMKLIIDNPKHIIRAGIRAKVTMPELN